MGIMVYSLLWVMQDLYHQPLTLNPIDPLKEPLKGPLIDPFKGTQDIYIYIISRISGFRVPGDPVRLSISAS